MKDAYSFDADDDGLDRSYEAMVQAYKNIYRRLHLPAVQAEADSGAIGGKDSHEFLLPTESGEDVVLVCPGCGYAANAERCQIVKPPQENGGRAAPGRCPHARHQDHRRPGRIPGHT